MKISGRRRAIAIAAALAATLTLATLQGCGGDDAPDATTAAAESVPPPPPMSDTTTVSDDRPKVLYAGSTKGFVATALSASMPSGSEGDYDVLVVGDADQGGDGVVAIVQQALADGKEVVLDAASDGSDRRTHGDILGKIVGTRIESSAVRIKKAATGYYVTPIDPAAVASAKARAAGAQGATAGGNSVQSVFGIRDSEVAQ